ncbi:hypothetical protein [Lignipirellula cremea]|uniref:hypothetical protein n=1 Tax=Lignipirellula cremea TaxID=2528010 RepID=UPI001E54B175|nr:hypothetical protein [Lignipirellula cremea]
MRATAPASVEVNLYEFDQRCQLPIGCGNSLAEFFHSPWLPRRVELHQQGFDFATMLVTKTLEQGIRSRHGVLFGKSELAG